MKEFKHIIPVLLAVLLAATLLAGCSESDWDKASVSSEVKVAQTQNYTLSESEMRVLEYQCFNEVYAGLYGALQYYSFGLTSLYSDDYVFPDIASYAAPEDYIAAHIDSIDIEGMAYERAETLLVYNESADREGYHADAEKLTMVKENVPYININTLSDGAKDAGKSLRAYIRFAIGNGVSQSDVENVLDLYARYSLFAEDKTKSLQETVSVEDAEKYREDHKSQFYYSEYISCELPDGDWVTEEVREKAAACKTFEELKDVLRAAEKRDTSADKESGGISGVLVAGSNPPDSFIVYPVDASYQIVDGSYHIEGSTSVIMYDSPSITSSAVYKSLIDPIGEFHRYIIRKNGGSVDGYEVLRPTEGNTIIGSSGTITDYQETITDYSEITKGYPYVFFDITGNVGWINGGSENWSTATANERELMVYEKHSVALPEEDDPNVDDLTQWLFAPGRRAGDVIVLKIDSSYHWIQIEETWLNNARHDKVAEDMVKWYEEMKAVSGYTADRKKD